MNDLKTKTNELDEQPSKLKEALNNQEQKKDDRPVTERIKTFEDAVSELGSKHPFVVQYAYNYKDNADTRDFAAYLKLRIICAALNEGWQPEFTNDERRYHPWFYLYTKGEWEKLDNTIKDGGLRLGGRAHSGAGAGFVYACSDYVPPYSTAAVGSRLCFKTRELAIYAGRQFIEIWADYLLG